MDTTAIVKRLSVIADSVSALKKLQKLTYDEFSTDHILYTSAERDFQVAIQAALDIASMILADVDVDLPDTYSDLFVKLSEVGVLPYDYANKLSGMARFHNVLVHLYLEVDLLRVYEYLQKSLDDLEKYAQYVSIYMTSHKV